MDKLSEIFKNKRNVTITVNSTDKFSLGFNGNSIGKTYTFDRNDIDQIIKIFQLQGGYEITNMQNNGTLSNIANNIMQGGSMDNSIYEQIQNGGLEVNTDTLSFTEFH
jgi:hypothetical protein